MIVVLLPESGEHKALIRRLVIDTITMELGADAWPEPMRSQLLEVQYSGRRHTGTSPETKSYVVEADGRGAGWILVAFLPQELRLVEIMVAPELRGRGIGGEALRQVQAMADQMGKPVRLNVNVLNAGAIRLYERLGFRTAETGEVQQVMEYSAR